MSNLILQYLTSAAFLRVLRDSDYSREALRTLARELGCEDDAAEILESLAHADARRFGEIY